MLETMRCPSYACLDRERAQRHVTTIGKQSSESSYLTAFLSFKIQTRATDQDRMECGFLGLILLVHRNSITMHQGRATDIVVENLQDRIINRWQNAHSTERVLIAFAGNPGSGK